MRRALWRRENCEDAFCDYSAACVGFPLQLRRETLTNVLDTIPRFDRCNSTYSAIC